MEILVSFENVFWKINKKNVLENINFVLYEGQHITILGVNGSGKTSLCKMIIGAINPTMGKLYKNKKLKIAYVPQIFNQNINIPIEVKDFLKLNINEKINMEKYNRINKMFEIENLLHNNINTLSGGQKQKVVLVRALIQDFNLLILDEATNFFDFETQNVFYKNIYELQKNYKFSVIMVSHDLNLVLKESNYVMCLSDGKICCKGSVYNIKNDKDFKKLFDNFTYYKHHDLQGS